MPARLPTRSALNFLLLACSMFGLESQVEAAVLNVARYDAFKLAEAVLGGQVHRVQRMLDGLQAEGEAPVLVHYALAEDVRTLNRVRAAMDDGRPLPVHVNMPDLKDEHFGQWLALLLIGVAVLLAWRVSAGPRGAPGTSP